MDSENYFKYYEDLYYNDTNEKELKFFAKLALLIISSYIINNEKNLNNLKDDIKDYIKNYDNEDEDEE